MTILPCKLIAQVSFKAGGDVFHHLVSNRPQHLTNVIPGRIQACDLHNGNYGVNDSIIEWTYTVDGQELKSKQVLQGIDEEKKTITWKVLEGELNELYKNMTIGIHVETIGGVDFITWTLKYELREASNPHPLSHLKWFIELTNDVEAHIFG